MHVVAVQDHGAVGIKAIEDFSLGLCDFGLVLEEFGMRADDRCDQGDFGPDHFHKRADFAGMVHADFKHAIFGRHRQGGEAHGDTPMVAEAGRAGVGLALFVQNVFKGLFGAGFADRAGDRDDFGGAAFAPGKAKADHRIERIIDHKGRCAIAKGFGIRHHGGGTAVIKGGLGEFVTIEIGAGKCDKQIALCRLAAVN